MRLKEERTLIIIEVILGLIVFITIALQYADSRIEDYNHKIAIGSSNLTRYLQLAGYHHQRVGYWESIGMLAQLSEPLKKELVIEEDPIAKSEGTNKESKELMNKYLTNEIDAHTLIRERGNLSRKKAKYYESRIDSVRNTVIRLQENPPNFLLFNIFAFKNTCLIIQLTLVCLAIIFLGLLLIEISKRTNK